VELVLAGEKNTTRLAAGLRDSPTAMTAAGVISPSGNFGGLHPLNRNLGEQARLRQATKKRKQYKIGSLSYENVAGPARPKLLPF
jgi:hypothetical protein